MCNALAVMGAGAANSAVGAYNSARSSKISLGLQANLAEINARMSESAAQQTLLSGQREEQKSMIATANMKGAQRASMAANGIVLGEGTANQVVTSTDVLGEIDANTLHANAVRSAWGYRVQGVNQTNQALTSRSAADTINPGMSAATSLVGSAASVASSWYAMKNAGVGSAAPTTAPGYDPMGDFYQRGNTGSGG
jgi:hypothetical protein